ncbi:hypothetical protein GCM10022419_116510 [Nonomuraea rosea]|uniref:MFS transporter n=1 Tax=Nonomuraea rosea TaxID=638574 RepID=A0ABP6ZM59_9ACTN
MLQTTQQVGGALGMAVLVSVLVSVYGVAARHGGMTHGINAAFAVATIFVLVAFLISTAPVRPRGPQEPPPHEAESPDTGRHTGDHAAHTAS